MSSDISNLIIVSSENVDSLNLLYRALKEINNFTFIYDNILYSFGNTNTNTDLFASEKYVVHSN